MQQLGLAGWSVVLAVSATSLIAARPRGELRLQQEPCPPHATEGWDAGDPAGWVGSAGSMLTVPLTGGHPGGYLRAENAGLVGAQTSAPPWIGDWDVPGIARIAVDLIYPTADLSDPSVRIRRDAATNGWYFFFESTGVNDGQWHHYEAPVDPSWSDIEAEAAGWFDPGASNFSFAETLASVGIVQVSASTSAGVQALGIDNFTLYPCLFSDGFESGDTSRWSQSVETLVEAW